MYSIWKLSKVYLPPLKNVNRIGCSNPQQAFGACFASRACYRRGDTAYVVGTPVKGVQAENVVAKTLLTLRKYFNANNLISRTVEDGSEATSLR